MRRKTDLEGKRIGRIVVVDYSHINNRSEAVYNLLCDCGKAYKLNRAEIKKLTGVGCKDCYRKSLPKLSTTHGASYSKLYRKWLSMIQRCCNPNCRIFKFYGAKGVAICDEWRSSFEKFSEWAKSSGYVDGLTIDRIDVFKGYSPDNCRWATNKEQSLNRRNTKRYEIDGVSRTIGEWCESFDISPNMARARVRRGMSIMDALTKERMGNGSIPGPFKKEKK